MQSGEAPTDDVERDWQRMERERTQLLDMKQQVCDHCSPIAEYFLVVHIRPLQMMHRCMTPCCCLAVACLLAANIVT